MPVGRLAKRQRHNRLPNHPFRSLEVAARGVKPLATWPTRGGNPGAVCGRVAHTPAMGPIGQMGLIGPISPKSPISPICPMGCGMCHSTANRSKMYEQGLFQRHLGGMPTHLWVLVRRSSLRRMMRFREARVRGRRRGMENSFLLADQSSVGCILCRFGGEMQGGLVIRCPGPVGFPGRTCS